MTVSGPKVRDFTDKDRSLGVIVESDPVYEVLVALFVFYGESEHSEYETGSDLVQMVRERGGDELVADIKSLGSWGELGLPLIGVAHRLPAPRTVEALVAHIRQMDPVELRTMLLQCCGLKPSHGHDKATIERAARGDEEAVEELFASLQHPSDLALVLQREPDRMVEDYAKRFYLPAASANSAETVQF